jgi:hypothetical protein
MQAMLLLIRRQQGQSHQNIPIPELLEPASGLWDKHAPIQIQAVETGPALKQPHASIKALEILYMEEFSSFNHLSFVFRFSFTFCPPSLLKGG